MTNITYIHGVSANELPQRGRLALTARPSYIPYTEMTEGEMHLALLREKARVLAAAYPDFPRYAYAATMIENALNAGVHNGVNFVGVLPAYALDIASEINQARADKRPVVGALHGARQNVFTGFRISETIIPTSQEPCRVTAANQANREFGISRDWNWYNKIPGAKKRRWQELFEKCTIQKAVEEILNKRIETSSHHVLYKSLSPTLPAIIGTRVDTKRLLHVAGVGAMANAGDFSAALMDQWVETAMLRQNAVQGVGPVDSVTASLYLAPDPEKAIRGHIGEPVTIAAITALVAAIGKALADAAAMQKELNAKKAGAMAAAQGFGTPAYKAEQSDYLRSKENSSNGNSFLIPALAAGAALYFATQK